MEAVVDYEFLKGCQNEVIVKELSIAAKIVLNTFHFRSPYTMHPYGSAENGLNWDDGIIPCNQLETALIEAVAGYNHPHSYGIAKCNFLAELNGRPVLNLEDFVCPTQRELRPVYSCVLTCHHFNDISCATRNAHSFYKWLKYHFQTKSYVECPKNMTRHSAMFVSAV